MSEVNEYTPCAHCDVPLGEHVTDVHGFLFCLDGTVAQPREDHR